MQHGCSDAVNNDWNHRRPFWNSESRFDATGDQFSNLPPNAERSILGLAIVSSPSVLSFFANKELTELCLPRPLTEVPPHPGTLTSANESWRGIISQQCSPRRRFARILRTPPLDGKHCTTCQSMSCSTSSRYLTMDKCKSVEDNHFSDSSAFTID